MHGFRSPHSLGNVGVKMPKIGKSLIGRLLVVDFWDHVTDDDEVIQCRAVGYLAKVTGNSITLTWWVVIDDDEDVVKRNSEVVSIIKNTIISFHVMKDIRVPVGHCN